LLALGSTPGTRRSDGRDLVRFLVTCAYSALFLTLAALGLLGAVACLRLPEVGREHDTGRWTAPITRV
jgi:hypothetical protein